MGKGQSTLFIIAGILAVIIVSFFAINLTGNKNTASIQTLNQGQSFSLDTKGLQKTFDGCSNDAIIKANIEYGLNEKNRDNYKKYVSERVKKCMSQYILELNSKDYLVTEGLSASEVEFLENTIIVKIDYTIIMGKDSQQFKFESYTETFPKQSTVNLDETKEILLISNDKVAKIIIGEGTTAVSGSVKIDKIGLTLLDKHFDGLENNIVVGNLVYEGLPDKTSFSKPVKLSINFRTKDFPLYINENTLSIAWWDEDFKIWRGLDTTIKDGVASAMVDHFTKFAIVVECDSGTEITTVVVPQEQIPILFKQKYSPKIRAANAGESPENYATYLVGVSDKFCNDDWKPQSGLSWTLPGDLTIIPTDPQIELIRDNAPNMIVDTVQELIGENYDFGISADCAKSALVTPFCCLSEDETKTSRKGWESCILDGGKPLKKDEISDYTEAALNCDEAVFDWDTLKSDPIIGYNEKDCIGGIVTDGNGDGAILSIEFKDNGNSCVNNLAPAEIAPIGVGCSVTPSGKVDLVKNKEGVTSICDDNTLSCNLIVAKGETSGDCTCTRQNEGTVFCEDIPPTACHDGKKILWPATGFSVTELQTNCNNCREDPSLDYCFQYVEQGGVV